MPFFRLCTISRSYTSSSRSESSSNVGAVMASSRGSASIVHASSSGSEFSDDHLFTATSNAVTSSGSPSSSSRDIICFQVGISAVDHSLVVSTKEVLENPKCFIGLDDPTGVSSNYELLHRSRLFKQVLAQNFRLLIPILYPLQACKTY